MLVKKLKMIALIVGAFSLVIIPIGDGIAPLGLIVFIGEARGWCFTVAAFWLASFLLIVAIIAGSEKMFSVLLLCSVALMSGIVINAVRVSDNGVFTSVTALPFLFVSGYCIFITSGRRLLGD